MNSLPVLARHYIRSVMLCGVAISLYAALGHPVSDLWNLLLIIILACQMSVVKVQFRFGGETCTVSMSFPFIFAALLTFGLRVGIMVAAFSALSQCLFHWQEKPLPHRVLFSVASLVLATAVSGLVYTSCQGLLPMPITNTSSLALLAGAVAFWLANTGLVSGAISLSARRSFLPVWTANLKWSTVTFSLGGFLAVLLVHFFHVVGIGIFVVTFPLLYLTHYLYSSLCKTAS